MKKKWVALLFLVCLCARAGESDEGSLSTSCESTAPKPIDIVCFYIGLKNNDESLVVPDESSVVPVRLEVKKEKKVSKQSWHRNEIFSLVKKVKINSFVLNEDDGLRNKTVSDLAYFLCEKYPFSFSVDYCKIALHAGNKQFMKNTMVENSLQAIIKTCKKEVLWSVYLFQKAPRKIERIKYLKQLKEKNVEKTK